MSLPAPTPMLAAYVVTATDLALAIRASVLPVLYVCKTVCRQ